MSILWSEVIDDGTRETANVALSFFSLTVGEKDGIALFYGVGRRTVERWFAAEGQQRRPCMVSETTGKRLIKMIGTPRLAYLRARAFLPCLLAVTDGIERELDMESNEYTKGTTTFARPSLELAIETALSIPESEQLETRFLRAFWLNMEIFQTGNARNPWNLVVTYAKPLAYENIKKGLDGGMDAEEDENPDETDYDEEDETSSAQWAYDPE